MKHDIRKLENGNIVVDFGPIWFVCWPNGKVITKEARRGRVETRKAWPGERKIALRYARSLNANKP